MTIIKVSDYMVENPVIVSPLTFRNTGMSSLFSKQFKETVEHHLVTHNKWETYPIKKYEPNVENKKM